MTTIIGIAIAIVIVALWLVLFSRSPYEPPKGGKEHGEE